MTLQSAAQTDRAHMLKVLITAASMQGATGGIAEVLGEEVGARLRRDGDPATLR